MIPAFSAWKVGLTYIVPLLVLSGLCATGAAVWGYRALWAVSALFLFFTLFTSYFFRDPLRAIPADPSAVVSPADGKVVAIEDLAQSPHYDGPCKRISIFLSVTNVHVNRAPFEGTIRQIKYKPGEFLNAMRADTTDRNEANAVWMDTPKGPMTVRQISGLIARRIVCIAKPGDKIEKGQKFGMIKFGSRTELYLPVSAEITTKVGDKVAGGESILARMK